VRFRFGAEILIKSPQLLTQTLLKPVVCSGVGRKVAIVDQKTVFF